MDSGKRFEAHISHALHALKGASMRIEDGGQYSMNRQLADYLYWPDFPRTYAIECKSTRGRTFPLGRLGYGERNGQIYRLTDWNDEKGERRALIAFEFYQEYRKDKRAYIIGAVRFRRLMDKCFREGRKSVPEDDIAANGITLEWDGGYDLGLLEAR